jgi:hypothetical protein
MSSDRTSFQKTTKLVWLVIDDLELVAIQRFKSDSLTLLSMILGEKSCKPLLHGRKLVSNIPLGMIGRVRSYALMNIKLVPLPTIGSNEYTWTHP